MKAFPWSIDNGESVRGENGMDLRDYFAAKAMQASIPHTMKAIANDLSTPKDVVNSAYQWADLMMEARKNETN
jgi:hypothetical protein